MTIEELGRLVRQWVCRMDRVQREVERCDEMVEGVKGQRHPSQSVGG
jgi:hypothetical protein